MTLILASTSPWRAEMLRAAGVNVECVAPGVDEEEMKRAMRAEDASPRDQADALAELKARRVSSRVPGVLTLGADQILALDGAALDKPATREEAASTLRRLRGQRHDLLSAAAIALDGAPIWRHIGRARLTMRRFSDEFLEDYLDAVGDDALRTPGAYMVEGRGAQLFSRIEGDHFTVLGLPLLETLAFLRVRGILAE